jgi:hypothetical protein
MPSVSVAQRRFFGWAMHHPDEAKAEGKATGMTPGQMKDFASTPEKGLPAEAPATKRRRYYKE